MNFYLYYYCCIFVVCMLHMLTNTSITSSLLTIIQFIPWLLCDVTANDKYGLSQCPVDVNEEGISNGRWSSLHIICYVFEFWCFHSNFARRHLNSLPCISGLQRWMVLVVMEITQLSSHDLRQNCLHDNWWVLAFLTEITWWQLRYCHGNWAN